MLGTFREKTVHIAPVDKENISILNGMTYHIKSKLELSKNKKKIPRILSKEQHFVCIRISHRNGLRQTDTQIEYPSSY